MVVASLSSIGYFAPIFAFLLVFIVVYALFAKTKVLGESPAVMLFLSFILSSFFILEANIVKFIRLSSASFGAFVIGLFFLIVILAFIPGIDLSTFFGKGNWFAWILFVIVISFFIVSSAYVWNWALNWSMIQGWVDSSWFGMVLLLIIAGIVSFVLTKK